MANKYQPVEQRLWGRVIKHQDGIGCWEWTGTKTNYGYGQLSVNGKLTRAHRLAYKIVIGEIPEGLHVLHKCDNPSCVNPDHLFVGTHQDNMRDMNQKGRNKIKTGVAARGSSVFGAKLTEGDILQIKDMYVRNGYKNSNSRELAEKFGVDKSTIIRIVKGKIWSHVQKRAAAEGFLLVSVGGSSSHQHDRSVPRVME